MKLYVIVGAGTFTPATANNVEDMSYRLYASYLENAKSPIFLDPHSKLLEYDVASDGALVLVNGVTLSKVIADITSVVAQEPKINEKA